MGIVGNLTPHQIQSFHNQGFLVIDSFSSPEEMDGMMKMMEQLLHDFDCSAKASVFSSKNQKQLTDDQFYESAERISFFFEGYFLNPEFYYRNAELHTEAIDTDLRVGLREVLKRLLNPDDQIDAIQEISIYTQRRGTFADPLVQRSIGRMPPEKAFDDDGNLKQPKQLSINKVGHALHEIDPVFRKFSRSEKVSSLLVSLGYKKPVIIQSMYIFKQPGIGGEVVPHQDNSFLYTEPPSCTGLWLALEDANITNGCLWAIPGSHKNGLVRKFIRDDDGVHFDRPSPSYDHKDFVALEVKAGSLVVLHGDLIHQSFENQSSKSRHAFSLHAVDTDGCVWAPENWLRRKVEPEPLYVP